MRFLKVEVENWMSFRHAELALNSGGLVLVAGENKDSDTADSNGSGKSALLVDAIPWALYGQTIRERIFGASSREFKADDVVNRTMGRDCQVIVEFERGGRNYLVIRYRKDATKKNIVEFYCDGVRLTGETIAETNDKIEKLVGLSFSAYCNAVVFAQGPVKRFTQCTDSERRQILEQFFDLSVFDRAAELAKQEMKAIEGMVQATFQQRLVAQTQLDQGVKEIKRLEGLMQVPPDMTTKVMFENKLRVLRAQLKEVTNKIEPDPDPIIELDLSREVGEIIASTSRGMRDIENLGEYAKGLKPGMRCPTCLQEITEAHFKKCSAASTKEKKKLEDEVRKANVRLSIVQKELYRLREKKIGQVQLKQQRDLTEKDIAALERTVQGLTDKAKAIEDNNAKIQEQIDLLNNQNAGRVSEIEELDKTNQAFADQKQSYEFWADGFGPRGIKEYCYRRLLEHINHKLNYYSQWLTGGEIRIALERLSNDRLGVAVDIENGAASYQMASGGQARRIDLCLALALQTAVDVQEPVNLMIVDEFDAGLDASGVDQFVEFLKQEATRDRSVFVISHNSAMTSQFENSITIQRQNGESKISVGENADRSERVPIA